MFFGTAIKTSPTEDPSRTSFVNVKTHNEEWMMKHDPPEPQAPRASGLTQEELGRKEGRVRNLTFSCWFDADCPDQGERLIRAHGDNVSESAS